MGLLTLLSYMGQTQTKVVPKSRCLDFVFLKKRARPRSNRIRTVVPHKDELLAIATNRMKSEAKSDDGQKRTDERMAPEIYGTKPGSRLETPPHEYPIKDPRAIRHH